jgi:3',5'-nucleoside bisphosphate phosphatase
MEEFLIPLAYDLHIHSCLSPCGDSDMTPGNIIGMAAVKKLDVIALTDHNSCKNCKPFMELAKEYGLIGIPGMELCTAEEVHVVCLFPSLSLALAFDDYVYHHLPDIPNNINIFGNQQICDEEDNVVREEEKLLITATDIPFLEVYDLTAKYEGIMFPAHIEKNSNSLLSNLGFIPREAKFTCAEVKYSAEINNIKSKNPYLFNCRIITNSDAHYLEHINEPDNYLHVKEKDIRGILKALTIATLKE